VSSIERADFMTFILLSREQPPIIWQEFAVCRSQFERQGYVMVQITLGKEIRQV
jgi:hypothetical protein